MKSYRSNISLFYNGKCVRSKNRVHLRGFAQPSELDRHGTRNLSRSVHATLHYFDFWIGNNKRIGKNPQLFHTAAYLKEVPS